MPLQGIMLRLVGWYGHLSRSQPGWKGKRCVSSGSSAERNHWYAFHPPVIPALSNLLKSNTRHKEIHDYLHAFKEILNAPFVFDGTISFADGFYIKTRKNINSHTMERIQLPPYLKYEEEWRIEMKIVAEAGLGWNERFENPYGLQLTQ